MAWNPAPEVAVARDAATKLNAEQVVIVYITKDRRLGMASYGRTRELCAVAGRMGNDLYDHVMKRYEDAIPIENR